MCPRPTFWQDVLLTKFLCIPRPHKLSPQRRRQCWHSTSHGHEESIELTRKLIAKHPSFTLLPPILEKLSEIIDLSRITSGEWVKFLSNASKEHVFTSIEREHHRTCYDVTYGWRDLCREYWILVWSLYDSWLRGLRYRSIKDELVSISERMDARILKATEFLQNPKYVFPLRLVSSISDAYSRFKPSTKSLSIISNTKRESFESEDTMVESIAEVSKGSNEVFTSHRVEFPAWMCEYTDNYEGNFDRFESKQ
jgi:hypothetical protein